MLCIYVRDFTCGFTTICGKYARVTHRACAYHQVVVGGVKARCARNDKCSKIYCLAVERNSSPAISMYDGHNNVKPSSSSTCVGDGFSTFPYSKSLRVHEIFSHIIQPIHTARSLNRSGRIYVYVAKDMYVVRSTYIIVSYFQCYQISMLFA